jgi:hypothetical protein
VLAVRRLLAAMNRSAGFTTEYAITACDARALSVLRGGADHLRRCAAPASTRKARTTSIVHEPTAPARQRETYLRDSMLAIAEIADMLGYNDVAELPPRLRELDRALAGGLPSRAARHRCP